MTVTVSGVTVVAAAAGEARVQREDDSTIVIPCEDRYEAQKLASLILVRDPDTGEAQTFVKAVVNSVGNEVVILLADGSSHSILLRDEPAVEAFADFVQSVAEQKHKLVMVRTCRDPRDAGSDDYDVGRDGAEPGDAVMIAKRLREKDDVDSDDSDHGD